MSEIRTVRDLRRPATGRGRLGEALRTKPFRILTGASLALSLALGCVVASVDRLHSSPSDVLDHPANPVTDQQSREQVVGAARQLVAATGMRTTSAGYALMSCKNRDDPPYQGAIYLTFGLPAGERPDTYLDGAASMLRTQGWAEGPPPNNQAFAHVFSRDSVTATFYRDGDDPGIGVLRLYGQCRNVNDHRADPGWVDVTGEVGAPR
ncbi:hypothetical protein [Mycobacterium sp. Marseille-P9652]|uniref:hypothetical protein n=1 Tax=Mycobacterium sp. Marseille-P9652 TaxID=2654950 RepID=UPI0018D05C94|nr:hypothetical protein [Mycobacterium sp. Marseille-P9652]